MPSPTIMPARRLPIAVNNNPIRTGGMCRSDVLLYVSSDLLEKIKICFTKAGRTTPSPPPVASGPTPPSPATKSVGMRIDGKDKFWVGDRMEFRAVIVDPNFSSPGVRPEGAYLFYWYVDNEPEARNEPGSGKTYSNVVSFTAKTEGTHTVAVKFIRVDPRTRQPTELGSASKTVRILKEVMVAAVAGANRIATEAKAQTKGFEKTGKHDVWVPFNFSFSPPAKLLGAKVRMVVWPLGGLTNTDELVIKGASGENHRVYRDFNKLKEKEWNTVDVDISGNQDVMAAVRSGRVEACIQDDTDVQSVRLLLKAE